MSNLKKNCCTWCGKFSCQDSGAIIMSGIRIHWKCLEEALWELKKLVQERKGIRARIKIAMKDRVKGLSVLMKEDCPFPCFKKNEYVIPEYALEALKRAKISFRRIK